VEEATLEGESPRRLRPARYDVDSSVTAAGLVVLAETTGAACRPIEDRPRRLLFTGICGLDAAGCQHFCDIHSIGIVKGEIAMTEVNQVRRKPATAAALSMLCTGLGHIYCGKFTLGLALNLAVLLPVPFALAAACLPYPSASLIAFVLVCLFVLAVYLYAIVDSCRLAGRIGEHYELKDYNRGMVYFLFIVASVIHAPAVAMHIRANVLEAFICPSESMSPTLQGGDRFLVNKLLQRQLPHRGDAVVFLSPNNREQRWVKRVIALPGDTVCMQGGEVYVNGKKLEQQQVPRSGAGCWERRRSDE
jgi:hypothetical protein